MKKVKRMNKLFGYFFVLIILSSIVFLVMYYVDQESRGMNIRYSKSVQISELKICELTYTQENIPKSVTVCGYIETDNIARLRIILFQMPGEIFIVENQPKDLFDQGYFSRELLLPDDTDYGDYLLKVVLNRDVVGEIKFYISPPETQ